MNKLPIRMIKYREKQDNNIKKKSKPDFIITKSSEGGLKSVIIEAKSHLNEIANADMKKMISDCTLHKCHGIMVISETAIIREADMKEL
jgi:hypothetical protein